MENFKSQIIRIDGNVWDMAILIPVEFAQNLELNKDRRVVCTINNAHTYQCALMHSGTGEYFINTNKEIRKKLGLELGNSVHVNLKADDSKYGMPLPEELKTAWELDAEANQIFHSITIGKQRSLLHIIGKLKSSEKRIEKSLVMLEYLKSVNGKLDFKELNEAFKNANKR